MKKKIFVKFSLEGLHQWAGIDENAYADVKYLAYPHRHMFHFKITCQVYDSNREQEFIMVRATAIKFIEEFYSDRFGSAIDFGSRSCEMIAEDIFNYAPIFNICEVEVSEDDENGAIVCS